MTYDVRRARTTSRLSTCVRRMSLCRMSVVSVARRKSHVQNHRLPTGTALAERVANLLRPRGRAYNRISE